MIKMKSRALVFLLSMAVLLLVAGTAVAQPVPLSASPDETRLMDAYPALRDARAAGAGIVITGVDQFGCNSGQLQLGLGPGRAARQHDGLRQHGRRLRRAEQHHILSGWIGLPIELRNAGGEQQQRARLGAVFVVMDVNRLRVGCQHLKRDNVAQHIAPQVRQRLVNGSAILVVHGGGLELRADFTRVSRAYHAVRRRQE